MDVGVQLVLFGTYIGIGALAHDFGFSLTWSMLCTLLVWAGPARATISTRRRRAPVRIAVCISSVRSSPMVVALLPMLKRPGVPVAAGGARAFHRRAVEALRLLPGQAREEPHPNNGLWHGLPYHRHAGDLHGLLSRRQAAAARESARCCSSRRSRS